MTSIPIDRKRLISEDEKNRVSRNQTLEEVTASRGISKQILTTWLMSRGEESRELHDTVKINLSTEDALGRNARTLFDYLAKKKKLIILNLNFGHLGSFAVEGLYPDSSGHKAPQKEGDYHSVRHHCHPLFHKYVHVDHVQYHHSL